MPPQVGRMPGHQSNPSNPYAHLPPQHTLPQYQQQQLHSIPQGAASHSNFGSAHFNGGIGAFAPSAGGIGLQGAYGAGATGGSGLASEEAYRGFARGAAQEQMDANRKEAAQMGTKTGMAGRIREVWANNLEQEMVLLRQLVQKYPYVSMASLRGSSLLDSLY